MYAKEEVLAALLKVQGRTANCLGKSGLCSFLSKPNKGLERPLPVCKQLHPWQLHVLLTTNQSSGMLPLVKKRKITDFKEEHEEKVPKKNITPLASLSRSVTPPLTTREKRPLNNQQTEHTDHTDHAQQNIDSIRSRKPNDEIKPSITEGQLRIIRSPIQLTHIRDLPTDKNIDTVRLHDILGDPMIRECWQFNYCFDVDFVMSQFDQDVKNLVQVKIVHGSWKQDSSNRIQIDVQSNALSH